MQFSYKLHLLCARVVNFCHSYILTALGVFTNGAALGALELAWWARVATALSHRRLVRLAFAWHAFGLVLGGKK